MARWIKRTCEETVKELEYKRKVSRKNLKPKYQAFCNHEIEKVKRKWKNRLDRNRQKVDNMRQKRIENYVRSQKGYSIIPSKPLVSKLKKKLLCIIQEYVRYRDTDRYWFGRCITCECELHTFKPIEGRKATGGHCLESKVNATAFDERNINLQCNSCNQKQSLGNMNTIEEHKRAIDKKHGKGTFQDLFFNFNKRGTLTIPYLEKQVLVWGKKLEYEKRKKKFVE